jgi:hypothetical protein
VSDPLIFPIIILAISGQHPLHDAADGFFLALKQQVNVIRHQDNMHTDKMAIVPFVLSEE